MPTSVRLSPATEHKLSTLAAQTGRTKAFYLREIIENGLQEAEDYYLAAGVSARVRAGQEPVYSTAEIRAELGLDD